MRWALPLAAALAVLCCLTEPIRAQTELPPLLHRVFLKHGEPLPSYGEPIVVDTRVIFTLVAGEQAAGPTLQLMTLPVSAVDVDRTARYTEAIRAEQYAATRGEDEFQGMSTEVARALDQLATVTDKRQRLDLAIEARRRLLAWSADHFSYRAADIQAFAGQFDEVIEQMRAAVGEPSLSLELRRAPSMAHEPLQPVPTPAELFMLAMAAADAADVPEERIAILRSVSTGDGAAGTAARARLEAELKVSAAYAALAKTMRRRAEEARKAVDVAGLARLRRELDREDRALGFRRPADIASLGRELDDVLKATRTLSLARATFTRERPALRDYNARVRPLLVRVRRVQPVITELREMIDVGRLRARRTATEIRDIQADLQRIRPPASLRAMHSTLVSGLQMAIEACSRRADVAELTGAPARDAAAAAAGALLLVKQARQDLARGLRPPTIQ